MESESKSIEKELITRVNGRTASKMALVRKFFLMVCTTKDRGSEVKERVLVELSVLMALFTMENLEEATERELALNSMETADTTMVNGLKINAMVKA